MGSAKDFIIENGILKKYIGPGGDAIIPEGVTEVGPYAFYPHEDGLALKYAEGRTKVKSVVIPDGVTKIGSHAFAFCKDLKKVTAPQSLEQVGARAFHRTPWLEKQVGFVTLNTVLIACDSTDSEIIVPEGITVIADETFMDRKDIVSVHLPGTLQRIGNHAFCRCTALKELNVPESVREIGMLAFAAAPWLEAQAGDFVIVNGILVSYKGNAAAVEIPNTVRVLAPYVFYHNVAMESAKIPESVTEIKESAFSSCENLKEIELPENITAIADNTFFYCGALKKVTFSENVKKIGVSAFYRCENLEQLPDMHTVETIGDEAFYGCKKLRDQKRRIIVNGILFGYDNPGSAIEIPDEVTHISPDAFQNTDLIFNDIEDVVKVTAPPAAFDDVWKLLKPKNKQAVAMDCFKNNMLHDAVIAYIKKNREKLAAEILGFDDAALTEVFLSLTKKPDIDTIEKYIEAASGKINALSYLLEYKKSRFSDAKIEARHEEKMEIDLGMRERTLKDWKEIFKLSVQDGCVRISGYKISEPIVEIPESMDGKPVTLIGNNAFKGNTEIEEVILPAGITAIGDNAFKGCTKLLKLRIPESAVKVSPLAFNGCKKLTIYAPAGSKAASAAKKAKVAFSAE